MAHESTTNESSKLFSQVCEEADPDFKKEDKAGYQFSNGRKFKAEGVQGADA